MKTLDECRVEIDSIDKKIAKLFEERMEIAQSVVEYKLANEMEIFQQDRERIVLEKNSSRIENPKLQSYAMVFFQDLMDVSKAYQTTFLPQNEKINLVPSKENPKIGYQGVEGAFGFKAMRTYFQTEKASSYATFESVFSALENQEIDYGVLPLENSNTGSINDNYDLLRAYNYAIVGEVAIPITHHLLGVKGSTIDQIKEVYSHPQGLMQCAEFLKKYKNIEQKQFSNTAAAAKLVSERNDKTLAAIASSEAAELYHLEVLSEDIQTDVHNHTRFIVVGRKLEQIKSADRISVVCSLNHKPGALCSILKSMQNYALNLTKIESRPIMGADWKYYFYIDFEGNLEEERVQIALQEMKAYCETLEIIGNYKSVD